MPFNVSPIIDFINYLLTHFKLDVVSGIAILMGGRSTVSALALRPLCGRLWHGWCNTPGCHAILWKLVRTLFQTPTSPHLSERLAVALGIHGRKGPRYVASQSGTVMPHTSHLADMLINGNWEGKKGTVVVGQKGSASPTKVTIVVFKKAKKGYILRPRSPRNNFITTILATIPTAASIGACVSCAIFEDWWALKMILLGMVCSGTVSAILGTGEITLGRLKGTAKGLPPGDGMLLSDTHIVVLRGDEEDVNAITKGKLRLELKGGGFTVSFCVFLMSLQVASQLVIMPSASPRGQLTFLLSLLVSGISNLCLSAKEDDVRSNAFFVMLNTPEVHTYQAQSRAAAAVLASMALCWESSVPANNILQELVPIKPQPWVDWSECLAESIQNKSKKLIPRPEKELNDLDIKGKEEEECLRGLITYARTAYERYIQDHVSV